MRSMRWKNPLAASSSLPPAPTTRRWSRSASPTPGPASRPKSPSSCSSRSSPPSARAWASASRSRGRSSRPTAERSGSSPTRREEPFSTSRCARSARRKSAMPGSAVVHIIDDDEALRESLAFLLGTARLEVRAYESATAFLDALARAEPGCIITDVRMPGISGVELLRRLKSLEAAFPVIVITGHGDVPLAVEAMKLGAVDFLEKPFEDDALLAAVRSALGRQDQDARHEAEKAGICRRIASLSTRERQVLDGLVAGDPNKTIAFDLGISPRTVEIYRANVMTKMKASSLSDLVRMALMAGFLANSAGSDQP